MSDLKTFRPSNVPEFYLANIPSPEQVINLIPFSFSSFFAAVGGAASTTQLIQLFADSDFLCISLQSDNVSVNPTVTIRDSSTNWPLMAQAVPVVSIFGTGALPYFLPIPWFMISRSAIQIIETTTAAVIAHTLTFSGLRVFRR